MWVYRRCLSMKNKISLAASSESWKILLDLMISSLLLCLWDNQKFSVRSLSAAFTSVSSSWSSIQDPNSSVTTSHSPDCMYVYSFFSFCSITFWIWNQIFKSNHHIWVLPFFCAQLEIAGLWCPWSTIPTHFSGNSVTLKMKPKLYKKWEWNRGPFFLKARFKV